MAVAKPANSYDGYDLFQTENVCCCVRRNRGDANAAQVAGGKVLNQWRPRLGAVHWRVKGKLARLIPIHP